MTLSHLLGPYRAKPAATEVGPEVPDAGVTGCRDASGRLHGSRPSRPDTRRYQRTHPSPNDQSGPSQSVSLIAGSVLRVG